MLFLILINCTEINRPVRFQSKGSDFILCRTSHSKKSLTMVFLTFPFRIKWYLMFRLLSGFTAGQKYFSLIMSQSHDLELMVWPRTAFLYNVWHVLSSTQGLIVSRNCVRICRISQFKKGPVSGTQVDPQQCWIVWRRSAWMDTIPAPFPVTTCFFTLQATGSSPAEGGVSFMILGPMSCFYTQSHRKCSGSGRRETWPCIAHSRHAHENGFTEWSLHSSLGFVTN